MNEEILLAQIQDTVDPIVEELGNILDAVKSKENSEIAQVVKSMKKEISSLKDSLKINVEVPEVDLSPIIDLIGSMDNNDLSGLTSKMDQYNKNLLSLRKRIDSLDSNISELVSALGKDTKVSIERSPGGLITNLYLIKK